MWRYLLLAYILGVCAFALSSVSHATHIAPKTGMVLDPINVCETQELAETLGTLALSPGDGYMKFVIDPRVKCIDTRIVRTRSPMVPLELIGKMKTICALDPKWDVHVEIWSARDPWMGVKYMWISISGKCPEA